MDRAAPRRHADLGRNESGRPGATAALVFHETPREELADLDLRRVTRASAAWLGITITGAVRE